MSDSDSAGPGPVVARPSGTTTAAAQRPVGTAQIRRRATAQADKPNSTRAAGAGGSSNTMLKLYTDDSPGLRVDPFIVLVLSLSFIGSIFFLHISAKIIRSFSK
ncbi:Pre protein translocase Sec Sec61-beta subunit [Exidia glandulosa HHB12029]|uniref:Pre protein translocase Sec Sec61-beta subunit n=1 Tax=Exidia glandulosa HHB12029 TaxID=1314781 RepID=A0A165NRK3_EXIGL|nr:Pre protein translocase Sec Sec61-beta subunit [Exidia glandulosa HHB12029]